MKRGALLLLVLLLAGCGGDKKASGCSPFGGGTSAQKSASSPPQTMLLTGVGTESDSCTDRVTFDFKGDFKDASGPKPGYHVEYRPAEEAQTEDASGNHIPIDGDAFLVVRIEPAATADITGAKLERTYVGPRTIKPDGMRWVQQVSKTGDFEAVLTWAIGLSEQRAFKVTSDPSGLTIELG